MRSLEQAILLADLLAEKYGKVYYVIKNCKTCFSITDKSNKGVTVYTTSIL